jgi:hypothetical protein
MYRTPFSPTELKSPQVRYWASPPPVSQAVLDASVLIDLLEPQSGDWALVSHDEAMALLKLYPLMAFGWKVLPTGQVWIHELTPMPSNC